MVGCCKYTVPLASSGSVHRQRPRLLKKKAETTYVHKLVSWMDLRLWSVLIQVALQVTLVIFDRTGPPRRPLRVFYRL